MPKTVAVFLLAVAPIVAACGARSMGGPCSVPDGGLLIRTSQDWSALVSSGCTSIAGDLIIDAPGVADLGPAAGALATVSGAFVVRNSPDRLRPSEVAPTTV